MGSHCLGGILIFSVITTARSQALLFPWTGDNQLGNQQNVNITIDGGFPFFNQMYTSIFVNIYGAITVGKPNWNSQFDPTCNKQRNFSIIAPYWSSVASNNNVYYKLEKNDTKLINQTRDMIREAFPSVTSLDLKWVLIATWVNVTQNSMNPDGSKNTFQAVVTTDGIQSYAIFLYQALNWSDPFVAAGSKDPAQAFFYLENQIDRYSLPGSCNNSVTSLTHLSNSNTPGRWVFKIDNRQIQSSGCSNSFSDNLLIYPSEVDWLGHKVVTIQGPCLETGESAVCGFYDPNGNNSETVQRVATVINDGSSTKFQCITPFFYSTGRLRVDLYIYASGLKNRDYNGYINVVPPKISNGLSMATTFIPTNGVTANFNWTLENFEKNGTNVVPLINIWLVKWGISKTSNDVSFEGVILINDTNVANGTSGINIISQNNVRSLLCNVSQESLTGRLAILALDNNLTTVEDINNSTFDHFAYLIGPQVDQIVNDICRDTLPQMCDDWAALARTPSKLSTCPPKYNITVMDPNWILDPSCDITAGSCAYNPGAEKCVIYSTSRNDGATQQCCYKGENIFVEVPGSGRSYLYHPTYDLKHFAYDTFGWLTCCGTNPNMNQCAKFFNIRPVSATDNNPPGISATYGEPHFITFDGLKYTFNGFGEYWLIKDRPDQNVMVQARFEYIKSADTYQPSSGITAFVFQSINTPAIQIQQSSIRKADIFIDRQFGHDFLDTVFETDKSLDLQGVHLKISQNFEKIVVSFAEGVSFSVVPFRNAFGLEILLTSDFKNKTAGLLGNYNDDLADDLTFFNGSTIPFPANSLEWYQSLLTWQLSNESDSLFYYIDGNSFSSCNNDPNAQPPEVFNPGWNATVSPDVQNVCGDDQFCIFDYEITGDRDLANETRILGKVFESTKNAFAQTIIICPRLDNPANGYVNVDTYIPDPKATATYDCFDGYKLEGSSILNCSLSVDGKSASWDGKAPVCNPITTVSPTAGPTPTGTGTLPWNQCIQHCTQQCASPGSPTPTVNPTGTQPTGQPTTQEPTKSSSGIKPVLFLMIASILWIVQ